MELPDAFVSVTDALSIFLVAALLLAVYGSWLATYFRPKVAVGDSLWFTLPVWGQVLAGFAISIFGAYIGYLLWIPLPMTVSPAMSWLLRVVGLILTGMGTMLWLWSRWTLGAMMGLSTATASQLGISHRLVQSGPYAIVRHPMYLGYWLVLAGLTVTYRTVTPMLFLIFMIVSLSRRARREDEILDAAFGKAWQDYRERVPAFAPSLW